MINAQTVDFTRSLPPSLADDERMLALARSIGAQLQTVINLADKTIIYAYIDYLPEDVLDILAYDLHVDWYDYEYSIETKRAIIKDSVKVHKRLGTVYATKKALGNVYPNSEIEEWFQYNGDPFYFRIIINLTDAREPADIQKIVKMLHTYKRLSAHLQEFVYQTVFALEIRPHTAGYKYRAGLTDEYVAGTRPQRNVRGGNGETTAHVRSESCAYRFSATASGTEPQRNRAGVPLQEVINADVSAEAFGHTATPTGKEYAGTEPYRAKKGGDGRGGIEVKTEGAHYGYATVAAGTEPQRNRTGAITRERVSIEEEAEPYGFMAVATGTEPSRTTSGGAESAALNIDSEGRNYGFRSDAAGENPQRGTEGAPGNGGVLPTVTLEQYVFKVKRCGTKNAKGV